MITSARQLADWEQKYKLALARAAAQIVVCAGPGCAASGSKAVYERLKEELMRRGSHVTVDYLFGKRNASTSGVVALESLPGLLPKGPLVRWSQKEFFTPRFNRKMFRSCWTQCCREPF